MKIKTRFMLIPLSIIFLSLVILTIAVNMVVSESTYNSLKDKQEQLVEHIGVIVDDYVLEHKHVITLLRDSPEVKDTSEYDNIDLEYRGLSDNEGLPVRNLFKKTRAVYQNFAYLETFTPDRAINVVLEPYDAQLAISEESYLEGFHYRDWYKGAIGSRDTYVSEAYSSASIMEPVIAISSPIFDESEDIVGIMIGALRLSVLSEIMTDLNYGETGINYVFDKNGYIVAHPDLSLMSQSNLTSIDEMLFNKIQALGKEKGTFEYNDKIIYVGKLSSSQWTIVSVQDTSEVIAPIRTSMIQSITWLAAILIIAVIILYINAHTTLVDIESLTDNIKHITMDNISKVDIDGFKEIEREDEIGILSESYIEMMTLLSQYSHDMEKTIKYRTAELSRTNHELEQALIEVNIQKNMLEVNNHKLQDSIQANVLMVQELSESKKMAALGGVVKGIAHEINTPLGTAVTTMSYGASLINTIEEKLENNSLKKEELDQYVDRLAHTNGIVTENLSMIANLINSFSNLIGTENSMNVTVNLQEFISNVVSSYKATTKVDFDFYIGGEIEIIVKLPIADMTLVFNNLIDNSILHSQAERLVIVIELEKHGDCIRIKYSDNGVGVEDAISEKIFEPFFTTERHKGHAGLGLHIAYNIINHNMNGRIDYDNGFNISLNCE